MEQNNKKINIYQLNKIIYSNDTRKSTNQVTIIQSATSENEFGEMA